MIASRPACPETQRPARQPSTIMSYRHELRVRRRGPVDAEDEVWQLPSAASPHLASALRVAGLEGRDLELVEHLVLRRLEQAGVRLGRAADATKRGHALTEDLALILGLLFRMWGCCIAYYFRWIPSRFARIVPTTDCLGCRSNPGHIRSR